MGIFDSVYTTGLYLKEKTDPYLPFGKVALRDLDPLVGLKVLGKIAVPGLYGLKITPPEPEPDKIYGFTPFTLKEAEEARERALNEPTEIWREFYPGGYSECVSDQKLKGSLEAYKACQGLMTRGDMSGLRFTYEEREDNLVLDFLTSPTPEEAASEELRSTKRVGSEYWEKYKFEFPEFKFPDLSWLKWLLVPLGILLFLFVLGYSGVLKLWKK